MSHNCAISNETTSTKQNFSSHALSSAVEIQQWLALMANIAIRSDEGLTLETSAF